MKTARKDGPDSIDRRRWLQAMSAAGALAALARTPALAQPAPDYKALVCINLDGGNDGENTLVRFDGAGYANYASVRPPASGINIPQAQLHPIQPASLPYAFGFHPACLPLKTLFDQRSLAVVANVGMLAAPSTKPGLEVQGAARPANLFSHSDQAQAAQSGDWRGFTRTGWGGRVADKLDAVNSGTLFPPLVSISGLTVFVSGQTSIPLTVSENPYLQLSSSGDGQFQYDALRDAALREILSEPGSNAYETVAKLYSEEGLAASSMITPIVQNPSSIVTAAFAHLNTSLSRQLRTVALLLEGRGITRMKRQVFFVNQRGYDTHDGQSGSHHRLLTDLAQAIGAFQVAVGSLGLARDVTLFTLSEFGRTFKPASNQGTDHGWGNYAFVVGGAVKGGDFYGTVPTMTLNGPDDFGKEGRWIPTTSLEQYGATLCRWFGIGEADLPHIFPNIGAFANTNLGFMA